MSGFNSEQEISATTNKMINIHTILPAKCEVKCDCDLTDELKHKYECELYQEEILPYTNIDTEKLNEQIEVYKMFQQNLMKSELMKEINSPPDLGPGFRSKEGS